MSYAAWLSIIPLMDLGAWISLDSGSPGSLDLRLAYVLSGSFRPHISIATHGGSLAIHEGSQPISQRTNLQERNVKDQGRTKRIYDLSPERSIFSPWLATKDLQVLAIWENMQNALICSDDCDVQLYSIHRRKDTLCHGLHSIRCAPGHDLTVRRRIPRSCLDLSFVSSS
jgi:hypothetical protein